MEKIITEDMLVKYREFLYEEEKSDATISKYMLDMRRLMLYAAGKPLTKEMMIQYKEYLISEKQYKTSSINSYLVAANRFFDYMHWYDLHIKTIRVQKTLFVPEEKELTKRDFRKLVKAAHELGRNWLAMVMQLICGTGMRVGEVKFVTVDAVKRGEVTIYNKGKERKILIQRSLQARLLAYIRKNGISAGRVFCTAGGNAIDRSYIWREMKKLCGRAEVSASKVFPHNLRALFAKTYYAMYKDLAKLADILGHSSIETTRIYIKISGAKHRRQLDKLKLLDGLEWGPI